MLRDRLSDVPLPAAVQRRSRSSVARACAREPNELQSLRTRRCSYAMCCLARLQHQASRDASVVLARSEHCLEHSTRLTRCRVQRPHCGLPAASSRNPGAFAWRQQMVTTRDERLATRSISRNRLGTDRTTRPILAISHTTQTTTHSLQFVCQRVASYLFVVRPAPKRTVLQYPAASLYLSELP